MTSRIVPPAIQACNITPFMAEARTMAACWGEPAAIFRYNDQYPEDVFVRLLCDLPAYRLDDPHGLLMLEAIVNPPAPPKCDICGGECSEVGADSWTCRACFPLDWDRN